jgi:hypothetical protein
MLLIAVGVGGYYFYISYLPKEVTPVSTEEPVSATTAVLPGIKNGGASSSVAGCYGGLSCYPPTVGGIDDYNFGGTLPVDTYYKAWETCNVSNNYCGTNDKNAQKKDPNTGEIWSAEIGDVGTWFTANNCKYPNGLIDGACDHNGGVACQCVKHTGGVDLKTGCEALGDGKWRLPYQKEMMQGYIDGSWANITEASNGFWTATTRSDDTSSAWIVYLHTGSATFNKKTADYSIRCVR